MKILSMTATFGKLDNETITFDDGLNVRSAPNEWGKSTWCAFLTAMLYGIDTRERTTRDQLADKERYQPWSGKSMEGRLRVLHEGRDITIERRTSLRAPLGEFYAYETESNLPVRGLTAENCGQVLLGVEKSVFLRTGFLRFSDLPVRQDENLRRRLNSLVTTGDESGNAELMGEKLRELKNRCRHNNTGLIPECQSQIRRVQEQLWERQTLQEQHDALTARIRREEAELADLELHRDWIAYRDAEAHRTRIAEAEKASAIANRLVQTLTEKYAAIPDQAILEERVQRTGARLDELTLDTEEAPGSPTPIVVTAIMAAVLLIAAVLMADQGLLIPCIVLALAMVVTTIAMLSKRRQQQIWYNIRQTRRKGREEELKKSITAWEDQIRTYSDLDIARRNARKADQHFDALKSMDISAPKPELEDPLTLDRARTLSAIGELTPRLGQERMQLGQLRGRMDHLPDADHLQRQLQQSRVRLAELEKTAQAIDLAQASLESASRELQRRFAPAITKRAGYFLSRLTGGVYDRIVIGEDLSVQAARSDEITLRSPQWRSEGTGDQMYLALRLAVWEIIAPKCPIILDDALIRFDQTRMERAMDLLLEIGDRHQILLFSCQDREQAYMDA